MFRLIQAISKTPNAIRAPIGNIGLLNNFRGNDIYRIAKCDLVTNARIDLKDRPLVRHLDYIKYDLKQNGFIRFRELWSLQAKLNNETISSSQALEIIKLFNFCGDEAPPSDLLSSIWKTLKSKNVPLNVDHYNAYLQVHVTNNLPFPVHAYWNEMKKKGFQLNLYTYQLLINGFCQHGDIESTAKILQEMNQQGLPTNLSIYNSLVLGHVNNGDQEMANQTLAHMKEKGLKPNAETLNNLLKGYAKTGDLAGINNTFDRFKEENITLMNDDIFGVICGLVINGHSNLVDQLTPRLNRSIEYTFSVRKAIKKLVRSGNAAIVTKIIDIGKEDSQLIKFFIREFSFRSPKTEQVIEAWKSLENIGVTLQSHIEAFEPGLQSNSIEFIHAILAEMKTQSLPIDEKHFKNLIHLESANGADAVLNALVFLAKEYDFQPKLMFIRDSILPALQAATNLNLASAKLRTINVNVATVIKATVCRALFDKNLEKASEFVAKYPNVYYNERFFVRPLVEAFAVDHDEQSFVKIIRAIHDSLAKSNDLAEKELGEESGESNVASSEKDLQSEQQRVVGHILYSGLAKLKNNRSEIALNVLNAVIAEGLSISTEDAERIRNLLGVKASSEHSKLLAEISAGNLQLKPIERLNGMTDMNLLTSEDIQRVIELEKTRDRNTSEMSKTLLHAYIREENVAKVEEILQSNEITNFSNADYAKLINFYIDRENIEKTYAFIKEARVHNPEFNLDSGKVLKFAKLMIEQKREWSEIEQLLADHHPSKPFNGENLRITKQLLDVVVESGDEERLNNLYNKLVEYNYLVPTNEIAQVLIKIHLAKDDLDKAISTFEKLATTQKLTPMKGVILKKLIENVEVDKIQRIFDLIADIYGESHALQHLALNYVESDQARYAESILEKHPKLDNIVADKYYKRFFLQNNTAALQCVLKIATNLNLNRHSIYNYLALAYCNEEKLLDALDVYKQQLEEQLRPWARVTERLRLAHEANQLEIPDYLRKQPRQQKNRQQSNTEQKQQPPKEDKSTKLHTLVEKSKALEAFAEWKALKGSELSPFLLTRLLKLLSLNGNLQEATEVVIDMYDHNQYVHPKVFRGFLGNVALSDQLAIFDALDERLDSKQKQILRFNQICLSAYVKANKAIEWFQKYATTVQNTSDEQTLQELKSSFPRQNTLKILQQNPDQLDEFETLAKKMAEKGVDSPLFVTWYYYYLNKSPRAVTIWTENFAGKDVSHHIRMATRNLTQSQDENGLIQLKNFVNTELPSVRGKVYEGLLNLYWTEKRLDDGLKLLNEMNASSIPFEHLDQETLKKFKNEVESNGKKFPYSIETSSGN